MSHFWNTKLTVFFLGLVSTVFYLVFWFATQWSLEDGMIVMRISENFAKTGALSFNSGQVLSSATSPIYAFMVGFLAKLVPNVLIVAKIIGIISTLIVAFVTYLFSKKYFGEYGIYSALLFSLLPTTVAYSVCTLETPFYGMLCAVALFLVCARKYKSALAFAALAAIARPDGYLVLAVVGFWCMFICKESIYQKMQWLLPAVLILVVQYIVHYFYYGALIPHPLYAKAVGYEVDPLQNTIKYLNRMLLVQPWGIVLYVLSIPGIVRMFKLCRESLILVLWYLLYHAAFMLRAPMFSWYLHPPVFVVTFFASIGLLNIMERIVPQLAQMIKGTSLSKEWARYIFMITFIICAYGVNHLYRPKKMIAAKYEKEVRTAVGHWLTKNTSKEDLVFTESIGFIGYYAHNNFTDYPGLVDKDISPIIQKLKPTIAYNRIIEVKKPKYLALRVNEWGWLKSTIKEKYQIAVKFQSPHTRGPYPDYLIAKRVLNES